MRDDLAHLTPEALTQVTNAGLVKRAVRELASGYSPQIELDEAETLRARFGDGIECVWPRTTPIQKARCTCGAVGVCRHRLIAVLAYQESAVKVAHASQAPMRELASVDDEELGRLIPTALLQAAESTRREGIAVDVRRRASGEPCDTARLPSATVRFWAGGTIEAARCDCVVKSACEHVALGVWAFRAARGQHKSDATVTVRLGPPARRFAIETQPFHLAVQALLQHGVLQGGGPLAQGFTAARAAATGAVWIALLVADLETWAEAYAQRSALYEATDGVDLIAELALRLSAGPLPGNASAVLGIGQTAETALDRLRLMSLGARTRRDGERRVTTLIVADVDTSTRLVLRHEWQVPEHRESEEASLRATERLAPGVLLEALGQGQLLAQQAARRADGSIRLARARSSQNSVLPQAGDWVQLATPLRFESMASLRTEALAHSRATLQPRHAARRYVVFSPHHIDAVQYDPNEQCLIGSVGDEAGETLLMQRTHERHAPHALDALAAALLGRFGRVRHVAGALCWSDGLPYLEPWALACDRLVVLDFEKSSGALAGIDLGRASEGSSSVSSGALRRLKAHLGVLLHQGVGRLPSRWVREGEELAQHLSAVGLNELSTRLVGLHARLVRMTPDLDTTRSLMTLAALRQLHEESIQASRSLVRWDTLG